MEDWRVLFTPSLTGALNMAIDQTIANFVSRGESLNTVRFYNWKPFCLSLGYHQNIKDVNLDICKKRNIDVAKRPTGGKAVFHANELTYSVIGSSKSKIFRKTIPETFQLLAEWLLRSLSDLGIETELSPQLDSKTKQKLFRNPSCFSSASDYEITVKGKKLIGSAQRRWSDGFLQHGSFLLNDDYLKVVDLLNQPVESKQKMLLYLENHTIYLARLISNIASFDEISKILIEAWQKYFDVRTSFGKLTDFEINHAEKIRQSFDLFSEKSKRKKLEDILN